MGGGFLVSRTTMSTFLACRILEMPVFSGRRCSAYQTSLFDAISFVFMCREGAFVYHKFSRLSTSFETLRIAQRRTKPTNVKAGYPALGHPRRLRTLPITFVLYLLRCRSWGLLRYGRVIRVPFRYLQHEDVVIPRQRDTSATAHNPLTYNISV